MIALIITLAILGVAGWLGWWRSDRKLEQEREARLNAQMDQAIAMGRNEIGGLGWLPETGAEHYREAERLLEAAKVRDGFDDAPCYAADRPSLGDHDHPDSEGNGNLAAAKVHALLAQTALSTDAWRELFS